MILPATTLASLLLVILSLVCWGSWANTQRLVFKWRFELFYYDFTLGLAVCLLLAAFTLGSMNSQELTVSDNMLIAGYRKMAYAVGAGVIVNLANMLLVAAISLSGMAVAFPLSFGVGLIVMSIANFIGNPNSANPLLLFAGLVLVLVAVLVDVVAYRTHIDALKDATMIKGPVLDPRTRLPVKSPIAARGIMISIASGIVLGFFFPAVDSAAGGDNGVGPYGLGLLIGAGMLFSTLMYVPFFINFPVQGEPVQVRDYFKGSKKQHFWGIFGGLVWAVGLIAALVQAAAPAAVRTSPALAFGLVQATPILAALWGLLAWREAKDSSQGVKMLLLGMMVVYLAGLTMVSLAPTLASK
jgi:glucose uptake protein